MRILHIIPGLQVGGAEIFLESLIGAWPRSDDQHIVVCFHGGIIAARLRSKNILVHELMHKKPASLVDAVRVFWRFSQCLNEIKPEIVVSALWSANICARILCWAKRIPLISVWHNNAQFLGFFKRYLDGITASLFPGRIVAVAQSVLDSYVSLPILGRFLKKRSIVVETGVDVTALLDGKHRFGLRQKFNMHPDRFVFGAVGRLIPVKAFSNLILAFHAFLKNQFFLEEDAENIPLLCIVGDGPEFDSLQGLVDQLKLANFVTLCGQQDDVAALYHGFSAYVSASMSEGLSVALLEALAVGLPFVVTEAGQPSGLFRLDVDGVVVDSHEVVDLALGLIKMYTEYDKYSHHSASRTLMVRKFYSIAGAAEKYATLIDQVSQI